MTLYAKCRDFEEGEEFPYINFIDKEFHYYPCDNTLYECWGHKKLKMMNLTQSFYCKENLWESWGLTLTLYKYTHKKRDIMRITKQEILGMLKRLNKNLNMNLSIDHNAVYGGYKIECIEETGGCHHPIGEKRLPAGEFYTALYMVCCAVELYKESIKNE